MRITRDMTTLELSRECFYNCFLSVFELEAKGRRVGKRRLGSIAYLRDEYVKDLIASGKASEA